MADLLSNPYTLLLLGDIVALFLYYAMHLSFYVMREFFKKHRILVFMIYALTVLSFFYANTLGVIYINMIASYLAFLIPLFICYKVNNIRGIIYFIFYLAAQSAIEVSITFYVQGVQSMDMVKINYDFMTPQSYGIILSLQIIVVRVICLFGNKDKDKRLDKEILPYVVLPIATIIILVLDGNRYLRGEEYNLSQYTELMVVLVAINILVFGFLEKHTRLMKMEMEARQNESKLQSDAVIMEIATKAMRERLAISESIMQQDRAMRHDRRHFEALLQTLLQDGKTQEALDCLNERLKQEPHSVKRYCENTTLNAAITHYLSMAEKENIKVNISANIPANLNVDEMQLAIVISNLIENAIHACEKVPESERRIDITARYKSQLLFEITNSCAEEVRLDEEGHPFNTEEEHGIGTRSVLNFINQTDSDIRYIAEEKTFKVRMLIN